LKALKNFGFSRTNPRLSPRLARTKRYWHSPASATLLRASSSAIKNRLVFSSGGSPDFSGQKRTFALKNFVRFIPKTDIDRVQLDVGLGPKAEIPSSPVMPMTSKRQSLFGRQRR